MRRGLKGLSIFASLLTYIVLLMGALVTNSNSATGCGASWPLCKGSFLPEFDYHAAVEFSHRAVSGMAGLTVVALGVWVWVAWAGRPERTVVRWLAVLANVTLVLQAGLGAAAVIWPQPTAVLALHFGISLLCFSAVLLLAVIIFRSDAAATRAEIDRSFQRWVWYVTAFNYGVVYVGALVRHMHASLACMGWPLCNGQLVPPLLGAVGASFLHRLAAVLALVVVIRMYVMARRYGSQRPEIMTGANLSLILLVAQIFSGAILATGHYNLLTQMLHSAIVSAYWGALSYLSFQVMPAMGNRGRVAAARPVTP